MNVIFAGTPAFAVPTLEHLLASAHDVVAVYTQPDRPAGRGRKLTPSPVKQYALQHAIAVEQPLNFKADSALATLKQYQAEVMIVVAYGLLLPESVLHAFQYGCINVHASLLPRWRGAAPIQRAIIAGDEQTGISIMQMDKGLDTGAVFSTQTCPITAEETATSLHDKLSAMGAPLLVDTLNGIANKTLSATPQNNDQACYAKKLEKTEAKINWHDSAQQIHRYIRGFNPWPVAFCHYQNQVVRIWQATPISEQQTPSASDLPAGKIMQLDKQGIVVNCGTGQLRITHLQFPGGKPLSVSDILNGNKYSLTVGSCFE